MEKSYMDGCWDQIRVIIDEAMANRDRTVSVYISPDGGMSVNLSPWPELMESSNELHESACTTETSKDEWPSTVDEFCDALDKWDRINQRIRNGEIPLSFVMPFKIEEEEDI